LEKKEEMPVAHERCRIKQAQEELSVFAVLQNQALEN
jgi:hypothetical protein